MTKAVLLAGDRFHKAEDAFKGIGPVMESTGLDVLYTTDFAGINKELLAGKRLLVICRDGYEWPNGNDQPSVVWMQSHQEVAIEEFVQNGGSLMVLHNSCWGYPWKNGYRRVTGGHFISHSAFEAFNVYVINKSHPITAGVKDYVITDEQHWLWFDYDRVTLLTKSQGPTGIESPAGWCYENGKGRVVYLGNGHTLEVFQHEMVQCLLHNAVRWLLRQT